MEATDLGSKHLAGASGEFILDAPFLEGNAIRATGIVLDNPPNPIGDIAAVSFLGVGAAHRITDTAQVIFLMSQP